MGLIREQNIEKTKNIIEKVEIFSLLTTKQKYSILNSLVREHYQAGTILFKKGDMSTSFYIIESGKVSLKMENTKKKDIVLGPLDSFGESAFRKNGRREGTAMVEEDLECLTIN